MVNLNEYQEKILVNKRMYERYIKFIRSSIDKKPLEGENHHIIPRCIGGTDDPSNMAFIGYREHYIAHYILAKTFNDDKLWFAFNCMRRVCNSKSSLYEAARKYISKSISRLNRGRKHSDESKKIMSKQRINTVIVRDKDNNLFRCSVNDPRYVSGEYVFYRNGYKHTEETKELMSKNGISGKKAYYDKNNNIVYRFDGDDCSELTLGFPDKLKSKIVARLRKPGRKLKLVKCPHCDCEGKGGNMTRYHFDNCNKKDLHMQKTKYNIHHDRIEH